MRENIGKWLMSLTLVMVVMVMFIPNYVYAEEGWSLKIGTGEYYITVINEEDTGISIAGDWFHAYQIFTASDITTYAVDEDFIDFFSEDGMLGGTNETYDFATAWKAVEDAKAEVDTTLADGATDEVKEAAYLADTTVQTALADYNQLAGIYVESFQNDLYNLAVALREYIKIDSDSGDYIKCTAHNQVSETSGYPQTVTLTGLTPGYYFVLDEESTLQGLGIASSGAFVPIGPDTGSDTDGSQTIYVKNSVPTVDKNILHNDQESFVYVPSGTDGVSDMQDGQWDIVGDYEIGDTAYFLITSTLPNNIEDYNFDEDDSDTVHSYEDYYYVLSDTMSGGITYQADAKVYIDKDGKEELKSDYYNVTTVGNGFEIQVNVKAVKNDETYQSVTTLYTHYTGVVNAKAEISKDYEENTITLTFNNNPDDETHTGDDSATVYSYTFDLEITKMDENGNGLAGATFGVYDGSTWIPVKFLETIDGVDYYYLNPSMTTSGTDGYIVTKDNNGVVGEFVILGLDDAITYTFKEESAPDGYNAIDPFTFEITATYDSTTGKIVTLTDNSDSIKNSADQSGFEADIINRKTVYLPSTGGVGTVIFQVVGILLMGGAAAYLLNSRRKKRKIRRVH